MKRSWCRWLSLVLAILLGFSSLVTLGVKPAFAAEPPVLDGLVDDVYLGHDGRAIHYEGFYPEATATLYVMEEETIDDTYIWLAWIVTKDFNDASYGVNDHYTWEPKGGHHNFSDLQVSDMQRLDLENSCGEMVVDVGMDLLDTDSSTPSGYGPDNELNSGDSDPVYINGGNWSLFSYDTSLAANLNDHGYCIGGNCNVLDLNVTAESPYWFDEENYIPAAPYGDWEYDLVWELRIHRDVFETTACPQGGILGVATTPIELHASPSKIKVNSVTLFPVSSSIGDTVWLDADRDGVQDVGEPGIRNVTLELYSDPNGDGDYSDGSLVETTITDANGRYIFQDLGEGFYIVEVTDTNNVLAGLSLTVGSTDPHGPIDLGVEERYLDADFGYAPTDATKAVIGDFVWSDADNDGMQDNGESGIGGVTIRLLADNDGDGAYTDLIATTTTLGDGSYLFTNLEPGNYKVDVTDTAGVLSGYTLTTGMQSSTDPTPVIHVNAGDAYLNADFGYYRAGLGLIGNQIWLDEDPETDLVNHGTFNPSYEVGLPNVTLNLIADSNGNGQWDLGELVVATTTAYNGTYQFTGLSLNDGDGDADYLVTVTDLYDVLWRYRQITGPNPGSNNNSQVDPYAVALTIAAPSNQTADFGFWYDQPDGLVGDRIWYDLDGDGVQDDGEPGIPGVTVELWSEKSGAPLEKLGVITTDPNGLYYFPRLYVKKQGTKYYVFVTDENGVLDDYTQTGDPDSVLDGRGLTLLDSDDGPMVDLSLDFGYQMTGSYAIGDTVWYDNDSDGVQDANEDGIPNVTLALYQDNNGNGAIDSGDTFLGSDTTDSNGNYLFENLVNGNYIVRVTDQFKVLTGYTETYGQNPWALTLSGADRLDIDFGYVQIASNASIGDFVWYDINNNGVQDTGERGILGVNVSLYSPGADGQPGGGDDVLVRTTTTNANGYFSFDNLTAGNYFIYIDKPTGFSFSPQNQGGDDALDSDANTLTGQTTVTTLVSGEQDPTWDAGLYAAPATLGDLVWVDSNGNGIQESGERGLNGVTVSLYDKLGNLIDTTVTASNGGEPGYYEFTNLLPAEYYLGFTLPEGYTFTGANQGSNDALDSDADAVTGLTVATITTLEPGEVDTTWDAGLESHLDYGDLPDSLNTVLVSNGARHIVGALYLGSTVGADADGQPGNAANGDDTDGNDDEDGVVRNMADNWSPGGSVRLYVSVTGSNGYLVGWFDWNGDRAFDSGERVLFGNVNAGPNTLSLLVPSDGSFSTGDPVYARFRLYNGVPAEINSYGLATNGEVEDYLWTSSPTAVTIKSMSVAPLPSINYVWLPVMLLLGTLLLVVSVRRRFSI
ncbi:MAG: hypothetical protein JXA42_04835 [Anaerolineales bacterium]|nr:hypothetical protein [Anaerolineales bacterium]